MRIETTNYRRIHGIHPKRWSWYFFRIEDKAGHGRVIDMRGTYTAARHAARVTAKAGKYSRIVLLP